MIDPDETRERQSDTSVRQRLARLRLRFRDPALEAAYRQERFQHNIGNVRFGFIAGIGLWIGWGILLRPYMLSILDRQRDAQFRFGLFIPLLVLGFGFSYTKLFRRVWEWTSFGVTIATLVIWIFYSSQILTLPAEYGWVGVILITSFTYTLLRLRFILVVLTSLIGIALYLPYAFTARYIVDVSEVLASLYLISFAMLGCLAAYWFERFARELFLRQRELDQERNRSDILLRNILPQAIVEQLKSSSGQRIAQAFDDVSVIFIDAVGSTEQAAASSPEAFADALDGLFRWFDEICDRHGLEKIKTIGDAYMAVAGAPVPMDDHAAAAIGMALEILDGSPTLRWPSGDPIRIRTGIASGPVVAGVIGERKFAYDVWGDTANVASRLQEASEPGQVLVSQWTTTGLVDRYDFGPMEMMDIRGRGATPVRALLGGRRTSGEAAPPAELESS
jgi:class 3 adenylate cyclase